MRNGPVALLVVMVAISVVSTRGHDALAQRPEARGDKSQDPQEKEKGSLWMKHKLGASQKILEGMTRGDFAMIEKNAKGMQSIGYLEGAVRSDIPGYKSQIHAFEHANGAIIREAQERNLDGVTIGYTQLMISCVQCHKLIRDKVKD